MKKYWGEMPYYEQPTTGEIKRRSSETKKREKAKGKVLEPVVIQGRNIVKNWWGMAWCNNLEQYADYSSRIDRGKRYVRTGAVIDLKIEKGKVSAKVQGTRKTPYKTEIRISPLSEERCQQIIGKCGKKLENVEELLAGRFPEEMEELFCGKDGLFPSPREISFTCSCPDWALMCKHVAAALYGVGARLDDNPMLFFELRGIEIGHFIDVTLANKVEAMLANIDMPSSRIMGEDEISGLFGVL
jgi:Uncharacterized conserved protein